MGQGEAESSPELNPTADVKRSWIAAEALLPRFPGSLTDRDSGRESQRCNEHVQHSGMCIPSSVFRHKRLMAFPSKGLQSFESSSVSQYSCKRKTYLKAEASITRDDKATTCCSYSVVVEAVFYFQLTLRILGCWRQLIPPASLSIL